MSSPGAASSSHVYLGSPIKFDPQAVKSVCYDETRIELVEVRNDGEFVRHNPLQHEAPEDVAIKLTDNTDVLKAKFSLGNRYLAVLRDEVTIDFLVMETRISFSHKCQTHRPDSRILDFFWATSDYCDIILVTNCGIEFYKIRESSKQLRVVKFYQFVVSWFVYAAEHRLLLTSSTAKGEIVQAFQIQDKEILRLPKFELESKSQAAASVLGESISKKNITVAELYDRLYCVYVNETRRELVLFLLEKDAVSRKYVINLHAEGSYAVSVHDNMLFVHNLESKVVMFYDIKKDTQSPVVPPLPLGVYSPAERQEGKEPSGDMVIYDSEWEFYQPNLVLDRKGGYLWQIFPNIEDVATSCADKSELVEFLLRRQNSKLMILKVLKSIIEDKSPLQKISTHFDVLNSIYISALVERAKDQEEKKQKATKRWTFFDTSSSKDTNAKRKDLVMPSAKKYRLKRMGIRSPSEVKAADAPHIDETQEESVRIGSQFRGSLSPSVPTPGSMQHYTNSEGYVVVEQPDLYSKVFVTIDQEKTVDSKFLVAVILEYLRSLNACHLNVQPYLYELLINILVANNKFYQLHQFLLYHVVRDSIPVAAKLLSLENEYKPAYQLGLDMLSRLREHETIVNVLLERKEILQALKFMRNHKTHSPPENAVLNDVVATGDGNLFYHVFNFYDKRNEQVRQDMKESHKSPPPHQYDSKLFRRPVACFLPGDCAEHVRKYQEEFHSRDLQEINGTDL
eukprot:GFYU01016405.1.p1 GENE.GFYU01016405.1~~GFYU01016405.1.p1  ORF type:complete len:738 (+),score=165.60 GFYU01016405.1:47-2260(+)